MRYEYQLWRWQPGGWECVTFYKHLDEARQGRKKIQENYMIPPEDLRLVRVKVIE